MDIQTHLNDHDWFQQKGHVQVEPPKNGLIALQTPRTSRLSTFYYCQVVNRALLRLPRTHILVYYRVLVNYSIKLSNILYHWSLSMASFRFYETYLLHIKLFVVNNSAISPFLGGLVHVLSVGSICSNPAGFKVSVLHPCHLDGCTSGSCGCSRAVTPSIHLWITEKVEVLEEMECPTLVHCAFRPSRYV